MTIFFAFSAIAGVRKSPCVLISNEVQFANPSSESPVKVLTWKMHQKELELPPELFLNREFLTLLREKFGVVKVEAVKVDLKEYPDIGHLVRDAFRVQVKAGEEEVIRFFLAESKADKSNFYVEYLDRKSVV